MLSTSLAIQPLNLSTMPLVWGVRALCGGIARPAWRRLRKAGVKQLPLSVSTWVRARTLLYEAAVVILARVKRASSLKD